MSNLDPALLRKLLEEHGPALKLYARQWCTAPDDAVQEALLKLVRQRHIPQPMLPWLYRVVKNEAISISRSGRRRLVRESRVAKNERWFLAEADELDAQAAVQALDQLPLEVREVIIARVWGGLTLTEIANAADISVSTVHRRFERGLSLLRKRLGATWVKT